MKRKIILLLLGITMAAFAYSQVMELEKTYSLTGEASIGKFPYVQADPNTGNYIVRFLIKQKGEMVKIESYTFDHDFNIKTNDKEELNVPDAKLKYPWWDFKGDKYESISVIADEKEDLVLKKKKIISTYDWVYMSYNTKSDVLDKVKLKNDNGDRYFHFRNWKSDNTDEFLYILGGVRDKSDKLKYCKEFKLMKINKDLDVVKDLTISFDYPQDIVYPRFVDEKTEDRANTFDPDMVVVFAPRGEGSAPDKDKTNFTYVRINEALELIDRIPFTSESTGWSIEDKVIDEKKNDVYFFGASLKGKNKYFDDLKDTKKFDGFQIMKVSDHRIAYIKEYSLEALKDKLVKSPSQKNPRPYEGKKFFISSYALTDNGSLFIVGQNWAVNAMATMSHINNGNWGKSAKEIQYLDCFGLAFDNNGQFLGQYLYDTKSFISGQKYSLFQFLFQGSNPDNIYWLLVQPTYWSWATITGGEIYDYRPAKPVSTNYIVLTDQMFGFPIHFKCDLTSSDFAQVDIKNGTLSDFKNFQVNKQDKAFYYLCPKMPFFLTPDHKLVLFGSQSMKKGKTLWFGRIKLD